MADLLKMVRNTTAQWALPMLLMSPRAAFADYKYGLDNLPMELSAAQTFIDKRTGTEKTY